MTKVDERGAMEIEWVWTICVFMIPMVLMVAGLTLWPERQSIARAASEEATRAAVIAPNADQAIADAQAVAEQTFLNAGIPIGDTSVVVEFAEFVWGEPVTVTVTIEMPLLSVPGVGEFKPTDFTVSSTGRIEDYRSLE